MNLRRIIVFSTGMAVGYVAGSAAGRERYDQISEVVAGVATDLGLPGVGERLRARTGDVARAAADMATTMTTEAVEGTADRLEDRIAAASSRFTSADGPSPGQA